MIPKTNGRSKDIRHYVGAVGIFSLVIGLLIFLSLKQIPAENKDIFVSIVGMIVGSLSVVIYAVIGKNPDEVAELQKKNQSLRSLCDQMEKRNDQLEAMIIKIQEDIIEKLTVLGASAFDTIYHKKK
jgi:ABC-type enterochelin transport system permease subunit|tara:strand:- start:1073 stop:1453 length:381 start_codon:yes stop_codon:yes gene_type:complete